MTTCSLNTYVAAVAAIENPVRPAPGSLPGETAVGGRVASLAVVHESSASLSNVHLPEGQPVLVFAFLSRPPRRGFTVFSLLNSRSRRLMPAASLRGTSTCVVQIAAVRSKTFR